jgi:Tfp pilus assembly protein PilZ
MVNVSGKREVGATSIRAAEVPKASSASIGLSRTQALASLQKSPSAVARTPTAGALSTDPRRRYPRASLQVKARLSLADSPERVFEASLPTANISVGGLFLESTFFLKLGTKLLVELELPPTGRTVNVQAEVIRIESSGSEASGFALRFTHYYDGSEVVLATHFLSPVLREFITAYAKQHRFEASPDYISHTADVLAAWELKKAEFGGDVWSLTSLS